MAHKTIGDAYTSKEVYDKINEIVNALNTLLGEDAQIETIEE